MKSNYLTGISIAALSLGLSAVSPADDEPGAELVNCHAAKFYYRGIADRDKNGNESSMDSAHGVEIDLCGKKETIPTAGGAALHDQTLSSNARLYYGEVSALYHDPDMKHDDKYKAAIAAIPCHYSKFVNGGKLDEKSQWACIYDQAQPLLLNPAKESFRAAFEKIPPAVRSDLEDSCRQGKGVQEVYAHSECLRNVFADNQKEFQDAVTQHKVKEYMKNKGALAPLVADTCRASPQLDLQTCAGAVVLGNLSGISSRLQTLSLQAKKAAILEAQCAGATTVAPEKCQAFQKPLAELESNPDQVAYKAPGAAGKAGGGNKGTVAGNPKARGSTAQPAVKVAPSAPPPAPIDAEKLEDSPSSHVTGSPGPDAPAAGKPDAPPPPPPAPKVPGTTLKPDQNNPVDGPVGPKSTRDGKPAKVIECPSGVPDVYCNGAMSALVLLPDDERQSLAKDPRFSMRDYIATTYALPASNDVTGFASNPESLMYKSVKPYFNESYSHYLVETFAEHYLQTALLNGGLDFMQSKMEELKKAASCFKYNDVEAEQHPPAKKGDSMLPALVKDLDPSLKALGVKVDPMLAMIGVKPTRDGLNEKLKQYDVMMVMAAQCETEIQKRKDFLAKKLGRDVHIGTIGELAAKEGRASRVVFGFVDSLTMIGQLIDSGAVIEKAKRECGFDGLPGLSNGPVSSYEILGEDGKITTKHLSATMSRPEYCGLVRSELSDVEGEDSSLQAAFPLLSGEVGGITGYKLLTAANKGVHSSVAGYHQGRLGMDPAFQTTDQCLSRFKGDAKSFASPEALKAAEKLRKTALQPGLDQMKKAIADICADPENQVAAYVENPAFLSGYFNCDRTRFDQLNTFAEVPNDVWPKAVTSDRECADRKSGTWVACLRHQENQKDLLKDSKKANLKEGVMKTVQIAGTVAGVAGFGGFASLPKLFLNVGAGAVLGSGIGYVLTPSSQDAIDRKHREAASCAAGYGGGVEGCRNVDKQLAELRASGPNGAKIDAAIDGAIAGMFFGLLGEPETPLGGNKFKLNKAAYEAALGDAEVLGMFEGLSSAGSFEVKPELRTTLFDAMRQRVAKILEAEGVVPEGGRSIADTVKSLSEAQVLAVLKRNVQNQFKFKLRAAGLTEAEVNALSDEKLDSMMRNPELPGNEIRIARQKGVDVPKPPDPVKEFLAQPSPAGELKSPPPRNPPQPKGQLPEGFRKRLASDEATMRANSDKTFTKRGKVEPYPQETPPAIAKIAGDTRAALHDTPKVIDWVVKLKEEMGNEMLSTAERLEAEAAKAKAAGENAKAAGDNAKAASESARAKLKTDKANELRAKLETGDIDEGAYIRVLNRRANEAGWRTIRKLERQKAGKSAFDTPDFRRALSDGDLIWDMRAWESDHGRDPHALQLLYAAETMPKGSLPRLIEWIGKSPDSGLAMDVWAETFDHYTPGNPTQPETMMPFISGTIPVGGPKNFPSGKYGTW